MIEARNITKSFGKLKVLKGIDLNIGKGEIVSVVGPSGAGKTTLIQIIGTLDTPDDGQVIINGVDVTKMSDMELSKFRNLHLGFVFQFHQLLPEFTARENVMLPMLIGGHGKKEASKRAEELLTFLGLTDRSEHKPSEMSGGEKQRVAIARALSNSPSVIFADEPSGNLDSHNAAELQSLFRSLRDYFGQTFVIVTHDEHMAERCDRRIRMCDGLIVN